jgi:hypothetical protein
VLVQERKLTQVRFPLQWVVRDVVVQDEKLECTSFTPQWNDVARDVLVLAQDIKLAHDSFPHNGMMLLEIRLFLGKRES